MHSVTRPRRAAVSLRSVLVAVLLLFGFGLWQNWDCADGMMASPILGATTMIQMPANPAPHDQIESPDAAMTDAPAAPAAPDGLVGLCLSVLVGIVAALLLIISPRRWMALLRQVAAALLRPLPGPSRGPLLAQLCVSRT